MTKNNMHTLVIGGGPAGMTAAIAAADAGDEVTLIERNEKLGKKLYITGKGRCNLTNICDDEDFFKNVVHNGRFLFSAMSRFNRWDLMGLIEDNGCPLKTERGGRVFPVSDKSSDVIKAFTKALDSRGVNVEYIKRNVSDRRDNERHARHKSNQYSRRRGRSGWRERTA